MTTKTKPQTQAIKRSTKQFLCAELYGYLHGYHKLYNKVVRRLNCVAGHTQFLVDASHIYIKTPAVVIPRHLTDEGSVNRGDITAAAVENLFYEMRMYTEKLLKISAEIENILDKELVKYDVINNFKLQDELENRAKR